MEVTSQRRCAAALCNLACAPGNIARMVEVSRRPLCKKTYFCRSLCKNRNNDDKASEGYMKVSCVASCQRCSSRPLSLQTADWIAGQPFGSAEVAVVQTSLHRIVYQNVNHIMAIAPDKVKHGIIRCVPTERARPLSATSQALWTTSTEWSRLLFYNGASKLLRSVHENRNVNDSSSYGIVIGSCQNAVPSALSL